MDQRKNVTYEEKLGRYNSIDYGHRTALACIQWVQSELQEFLADEDRCILNNIEFYLQSLNGHYALEDFFVLHDGAEYPYVGQHVFCYNSYGKGAEMVYNPEGLEDYEWIVDGHPVLAWVPDPRSDEERQQLQ